jgi:RNA polymerase subunit RPABC4/transcription elongation factor Spt4
MTDDEIIERLDELSAEFYPNDPAKEALEIAINTIRISKTSGCTKCKYLKDSEVNVCFLCIKDIQDRYEQGMAKIYNAQIDNLEIRYEGDGKDDI